MVYRSMGVLFENSKGTIVFTEYHENAGNWNYQLINIHTYNNISEPLINDFIEQFNLHFKVSMITIYTAEYRFIVNGASVAASTTLPIITDLPAIDIQLGGSGEFYKSAAEKLGMTDYKMTAEEKAICIGFMGILRWREEYNFLSSVTGASRNSIGGAIWLGQEA